MNSNSIRQLSTMNLWGLGAFFVGFCTFVLWWIYALGDFMAGEPLLVPLLIFIGVPLAACWLFLGIIWQAKLLAKWHVVFLAALTLFSFVAFKQPWNPRVAFVAQLRNLVGKTVPQVQAEMQAHDPSKLSTAEAQYVPEQIWALGVDQSISFRWNLTDGRYNADIGIAYFKNGVVVATDFLPD